MKAGTHIESKALHLLPDLPYCSHSVCAWHKKKLINDMQWPRKWFHTSQGYGGQCVCLCSNSTRNGEKTWILGVTEQKCSTFISVSFGINRSIKCKNICVGSLWFRKTVWKSLGKLQEYINNLAFAYSWKWSIHLNIENNSVKNLTDMENQSIQSILCWWTCREAMCVSVTISCILVYSNNMTNSMSDEIFYMTKGNSGLSTCTAKRSFHIQRCCFAH